MAQKALFVLAAGDRCDKQMFMVCFTGKRQMFLLSFEGIQRLKNLNYVNSVFQLVHALLYWWLLLLGIHLGPSCPGGVSRWGWKTAWTGWMGWGQQGWGFGAEFNALHRLSHSILLE